MTDPPVRCRDLACGYGDFVAVRNVDLCIRRQEFVAILGGSGAGKTSLLKTLAGLLVPVSGVTELFGKNLYTTTSAERRALLRRIGVLFQQDALFGSKTILDNVCLPVRELTTLPDPITVELARARLSLVGLLDIVDRLPSQVSGGQAKRAALARATMLDPEILFCDEPTAALDPIAAASVDDTLLRFRELLGTTVIMVSHDVASIERTADIGVYLSHDGVLAREPIGQLKKNPDPFLQAFFARGTPRGASKP